MTTPANPGAWRHPLAAVYTNAHQIAEDVSHYGMAATVKVHRATRHYGMLLETRVKANASGRPGPRVITGAYRRSLHAVFWQHGTEVGARIQTNAPQARRLEYGFVGADRLGRVYNQPPFPHFGPAVAQTEPEYLDALRRAIEP